MTYTLQFYAVKVLVFSLGLLPVEWSSWIARGAGDLFYFAVSSRREVALGNIDRAYGNSLTIGQKKILARKSFQNTALSILELFLTKKVKPSAQSRFTIHGLENMRNALARGKGAVLITTHLGSWEFLEFFFYLTGIHCSVIVKNIKNPHLDKEISQLRLETTVVPIPKKNSIRKALEVLKKNQVLAVLIDQWAGPEGLWVDFMGTPTSTTSLPARLAEKTGCALVPGYCLRKSSGQYEIQIHPAVSISPESENWEEEATIQLNQGLEKQIRLYPEQWSWAHKRWKPKPSHHR